METGLYALLTKIGAIFGAILAFFHISTHHIDVDNVLNYLPFISATIQGKPTPMITRIIEMSIGGAVTILLGYIFMVPSLSKDISKNTEIISYKLDTLVNNQEQLKHGQDIINANVNNIDKRVEVNHIEIESLKRDVYGKTK